jgi:glycosyltransferase involved in cell wall biosynthesis
MVGGLPEVVAEGETGLLFEPGDVEGMANVAVKLLTDESEHARLSRAARERARTEFSAERIVPMYEGFYERVMGGRNS